jgi:small subunit ribosomal protein S13
MISFLNKELIKEKKLNIAITKVYGIGYSLAKIYCRKVGLSNAIKVGDITEAKLLEIYRLLVNNYLLDYQLKQRKDEIIKKRINVKSYKGLRYIYNLPSNGQRTKTNSRTARNFKIDLK